MRRKTLQLEGKRYGTIQVIGKGSKPRYWRCRCDCGRIFEARGSRLHAGRVKCLCQRSKHGHAMGGRLTPTYQSWKAMKARCRNLKIPSHGGRGIRYDPRWERFENFLADMGERPPGRSLDRVDPWYHYCKQNCIWADDLTQARHKRKTEILVYAPEQIGKWGSPTEWVRFLRHHTGNPLWTVRQLKSVLKTLTLDQIIGAIHPQRLSPRELYERDLEARKTEQQKKIDAMIGGWFQR